LLSVVSIELNDVTILPDVANPWGSHFRKGQGVDHGAHSRFVGEREQRPQDGEAGLPRGLEINDGGKPVRTYRSFGAGDGTVTIG
jgi:hypothetical protein